MTLAPNGYAQQSARPRARDLGLKIGILPPGSLNAITDVPGVTVGQTTIIRGDNVRTGITAVLPHGGNLFQEKVPGAVYVGNGFGKLAGSTQVNELGEIETPILLTSTLAVPKTADFLPDYEYHDCDKGVVLRGRGVVTLASPPANCKFVLDDRGPLPKRPDRAVHIEVNVCTRVASASILYPLSSRTATLFDGNDADNGCACR